MTYPFAIFDVDGTLLDTTEGIGSSIRHVIETCGLPDIDDKTLATFIGPPVQDSFGRVFGYDKLRCDELASVFRDYYKSEALYLARPYEGIFDVLDALEREGVAIAVATYKRQDYAEDILRHFGFDRYSDVLHGADFEGRMRKVDIIAACLSDLEADASDAVMIGDSLHDAKGAYQVGTAFLGVSYGFGFTEKEGVVGYPSIGVARTPAEILSYI